jgi:hypothetical protein
MMAVDLDRRRPPEARSRPERFTNYLQARSTVRRTLCLPVVLRHVKHVSQFRTAELFGVSRQVRFLPRIAVSIDSFWISASR